MQSESNSAETSTLNRDLKAICSKSTLSTINYVDKRTLVTEYKLKNTKNSIISIDINNLPAPHNPSSLSQCLLNGGL